MIRELVKRPYDGGLFYLELSGDSTDTKPTAGVLDGSIFSESNTGKVYFFNEKSGGWVEQFCFQG